MENHAESVDQGVKEISKMSQVGMDQQEAKPEETCVQNGEVTAPIGHGDKVNYTVDNSRDSQQGDSIMLSKEAQYAFDKDNQQTDSPQSPETSANDKDKQQTDSPQSPETSANDKDNQQTDSPQSPETSANDSTLMQENMESTAIGSNQENVQSNENSEAVSQEECESEMPPSNEIHNSEDVADSRNLNPDESTSHEDVNFEISPSDGAHISEDVTDNQSLSPDKGASLDDDGVDKSSDEVNVSVNVAGSHCVSRDEDVSNEDVEMANASETLPDISSSQENTELDIRCVPSSSGTNVSLQDAHDQDISISKDDVQVENPPSNETPIPAVADSQAQDQDKNSSKDDVQIETPPSNEASIPVVADSQPEESQNEKNSNTSQNKEDKITIAHDDDDDEDIIVISETPKSVNKKPNLTTVFKCVRCGQVNKSRSELNAHLLQEHKLIIVSKQKSVDCIFCTKSLEMSSFYQHLRTEHKVLLVKSKDQASASDKSGGEKVTTEKTLAQTKISTPKGVIDLTTEEEEESTKSSDKAEKRTSVSKDHSSDKSPLSVPSTSKETTMNLRRTPRRVTSRKYTEVNTESSSSDDNEPLDAFEDDDDYDPHESESPRGKKSRSKSQMQTKAPTIVTKSASQPKKAIRLQVNSSKSTALGTTGHALVPTVATTSSGGTALTVTGPGLNPKITVATAASLTTQVHKSVGALSKVPVNQVVKFNGSLYTVYQSGDNKYLIPLNTATATAPVISTVRTSTPVMSTPVMSTPVISPQVNSTPGISAPGMSVLQMASPQTIGSVVNTPGISALGISNPQITAPVAVSQLAIPPVPQLATGVGNLPLKTVPANALLGQQGNIFQARGVGQQPVILSSPIVQPMQTFLVSIPQQNTRMALQHQNQTSGQVQSTAAISTQAGNSTLTFQLQNGNILVPAKPSVSTVTCTMTSRNVTTTTLSAKNITPAVVPIKNIAPVTVPAKNLSPAIVPIKNSAPALAPTPAAIHIAKPQDISSSDLHKTGGLFALEVCLDTATHLGTEPMPETVTTYILQEKETVFVEPPKNDDTQDVETEKALSDAEKCKVVIATAISRGHLIPNDLTSISNDVFFECTRCNSCFPLHIQLNLHLKQCCQLAPTCLPKIKIHSPASVLEEFYKDPTGGRNFLYMYCRFCRARIVRNQHDHSLLISHLLKHIEPKVELAVLPKKHKGVHHNNSAGDCTAKALEWVDYIVPPFTLDNPPTSAKNGSLNTYTSTEDPALLFLSKKKKKKKKKKKHKYRDSDSDEDYENLAGTRLSSLRSKNGRYIGTLRPKETSPQQTVSNNGAITAGSSIDPAGTKHRGGRTMMHSFKHIRSPNKRGSTLTASIPMKSKYRDKDRPGESTRRWNNGKTRSQLQVHRRRSSRFYHLRDHDASTPDDSTPEGSVDFIEVSSDEDGNKGKDTLEGTGMGLQEQSNSPVTITEDDISDYVKIIDEAEELQVGPKATLSSSPTANEGQRQEDSDLVDYYGNDVNSTLSCEPLIMEPEQVICYFKKCPGSLMECQFRSCGSKVPKNIRAMLGHIRVHFQILVPMQLLAKCGSQFPRQSIPRPLCLTFTQVQAHFTIADMQEANLHLGEVQQLYTCNWKNCLRSRCYKKSICGHLVKHIFFTLISKEDYQTMAQTMSTYSPTTEETVVKKLKIVAVNKAGEKVSMMVTIPLSQTKTPELLKAAIRKSLASDKSIKLPSQVLESIAAKFSSDNASTSPAASSQSPPKTSTEKEKSDVLTQAEIAGVRKQFPNLLEKWKMVDADQVSEGSADDSKEGEKDSEWTPVISEVKSLTSSESVMRSKKVLWRRSKINTQRWRSVFHKRVPVWTFPSKSKKGELKVIERSHLIGQHVSGKKRKGDCAESVNETPPNKKERVENERACETNDEDEKSPPEKTIIDPVITTDSAMDAKEDAEEINPENDLEGSNSRISVASSAEDMAEEKDSASENTVSDASKDSTDASTSNEKKELEVKRDDQNMSDITKTEDQESPPSVDQADGPSIQQDEEDVDVKKPSEAVPLKTKVVLALSSRQVSKSFRFIKSHKKKIVKVAGRGYGYGVFHCRMPQCGFFKEVMAADRKIDIVRALATHLQEVHMRNNPHRTIVLKAGSKEDQSYPKKQILQCLKDLSTYQDLRKFKLKNMFKRRGVHRTRLLQVDGRRVRVKVKHFHSCLSRKCFFGCFNATRPVLINHLQTHLRQIQRCGQKTGEPDQMADSRFQDKQDEAKGLEDTMKSVIEQFKKRSAFSTQTSKVATFDDSLPNQDPSSSHQSQFEEQRGPVAETDSSQDSQLPALPDVIPEPSENSQGQSNDGMQDWETSTQESTDQLPTRDSVSPMDQGMNTDAVSGPTDPVEDQEMDTIDGGTQDGDVQDDASMDDVDMMDVGDSIDGSNDGIGASGASRSTEEDKPNEISEGGSCTERLPTTVSSSGDAIGAENVIEKDTENCGDGLQDRTPEAKAFGDGVEQSMSSQTSLQATDASPEAVTTLDASHPLSPSQCTPASNNMDELRDRPGESVQMFYDELQSYFSCYTTEMTERKRGNKEFSLVMFSCPKCKKMDLRGENLPGHLETHINKKVLVTSVDNIVIHDVITVNGQTATNSCMTDAPEMPKDQNETNHSETTPEKSECLPEDNVNPAELDDQLNSKDAEDGDTISFTEEEILQSFFSKELVSVNPETQIKSFGCEYLRCNRCSYRTLTILDTPKHIETHIKRTVILKK